MEMILMPPDSFPQAMKTEKERYSYIVRSPTLLLPLLTHPLAQRFVLLAVWLQTTYRGLEQ